MPIYEFHCKKCDLSFELTQKITETKKWASCPECGEKSRKSVVKCSFVIKGARSKNNFYIPPKNEDIGLEPENVLLKRAEDPLYKERLHHGRDFTQAEREYLLDRKSIEDREIKREEKRIETLKKKHRQISGKLDDAFKKARKKTVKERKRSLAKRAEKGMVKMETLKAKKEMSKQERIEAGLPTLEKKL